MIRFDAVTKKFGNVVAVDRLNLTIKEGTLFGCLGPNGAGKTTTIRMLTGILRPQEGKVTLDGINVHSRPLEAKRLFGYVPDKPYMYGKLTAEEIMSFVGGVYGMSPEKISAKTDELFTRFEITEWRKKRADEYSLGMKQKLLISAAFIHDPKVVVIDEPMAGLDPKSIRNFKIFLREKVSAGATVFLSTHSLPIAEELCDRIGILGKGKLLFEGTLAEARAVASDQAKDLETFFLEITGGSNEQPVGVEVYDRNEEVQDS